MRKQTKIAAVVSAAALLALGASITSFAAVKGTWQMEDGEWYCYDKNGDVIENDFCVSNGKDYYVGEDGTLVRSNWVDDGEAYYFVNSAGEKITNDWRLATPYDDEEADEEWYYFQSSGKMAAGKKLVIKGSTYYFDGDGKMLTGWVDTKDFSEADGFDADMVYCDEETGARLKSQWIETTAPEADEDDEDADTYYYYIGSSGKATTGKKASIAGQTYFFNPEGQMLSGWVAEVATDANAVYYAEIGVAADDLEAPSQAISAYENVYFCGASDDGHMKKDKWIKEWKPAQYDAADEDNGKKWYWIDKNGKVYAPGNASATNAEKYTFEEGELVLNGKEPKDYEIVVSEKKVNSKTYYFNADGEMVSGFVMMNDVMFYLGGGDDGSMKTGSQTIADDCDDNYKFYFETKTNDDETILKGAGVSGQKSGKLYENGKLVVAEDAKYERKTVVINGNEYEFIVNQSGSIQHRAIEYKEDGDTVINASKFTFEEDKDAGYTKYSFTE